jgi:hypothetical protein
MDVQLEELQIKKYHAPLNFVSANIGLAQKSFLAQIGWDIVERDLYLGRVFNYHRKLLDDWVTFHGRRHLVVRGADERAGPDYPIYNVRYRCCHICGRVLYGALRDKHHYLYPSPPTDAEIFEDRCSLIVPDYLFAKLEIPKKAKIAIDRLEVLDEPLDGFGILEPWESDRSKWGDRHRSMRGCTVLTDSVRRQGSEDVEAMNQGYYHSVYWHFFPDPETGRIEMTPELREAVEGSGIQCVLHE